MLIIEELLEDPPESASMYLHMTRFRIQAESVTDLVRPYAGIPGYLSYRKNYGQILDATRRLTAPAGQRTKEIFTNLDGGGWSALEFADEVLACLTGKSRYLSPSHDQQLVQAD